MVNRTKFYITVNKQDIVDKSIYYLFFSKGLWVNSLIKVGDYNYIVLVEYNNNNELDSIVGDYRIRGTKFQVRRIFKSLKLRKSYNGEPRRNFINAIIILASSRIKGADIKIISKTNESDNWKKALIKQWQEEIDHPNKFKELGIIPQMDISPDGELRFHINKVGDYIITYFDGDISKYYNSIKRLC